MQSLLFPHDTVRSQQDLLIKAVLEAIDSQGQLIVHAPTGLGKTAASLAPAIERAIKLDKVVIFMTSRLTQHKLALETVSRIRSKHNVHVPVVDLIGKKHMCLQPGVERLGGKEFAEYCKSVREDGLCEQYTRLKSGEQLSTAAKSVLVQLGKKSPNTPEQVRMLCADEEYNVCPYEITMLMAKDARVIIADYSYIFNETIRDNFFKRINRELKDCILVVDEGHNLPERVKELATERVSTLTVKRAITELGKLKSEDHRHHLQRMMELLARLAERMADEKYIKRDDFLDGMHSICRVEELIEDLEEAATLVREEQKSSSCGTIADFLTAWAGDDEGFTRILKRKEERERAEDREEAAEEQHALFADRTSAGAKPAGPRRVEMSSGSRIPNLELAYRCLDPAVITKPVFDEAYSTVIMSGTLTPTQMYAAVLGVTDAQQLTLASPFPHENRLNIIVPKTTTKFTTRSAAMYDEMARICGELANSVPGNSAIFFPSYAILEQVKPAFEAASHRTIFTEHPSFTKEEREELLSRFKGYKHTGAVLLGVMGGSFSEGIDLPGDELRAVIIVGLPLGRPDLETKALIDYYDRKFGKGWDYGYTFPAFNKTLQSAGRCIRTETDRGAIIFLDERYAWQSYYQCFPKEWKIRITLRYDELLKDFFKS